MVLEVFLDGFLRIVNLLDFQDILTKIYFVCDWFVVLIYFKGGMGQYEER